VCELKPHRCSNGVVGNSKKGLMHTSAMIGRKGFAVEQRTHCSRQLYRKSLFHNPSGRAPSLCDAHDAPSTVMCLTAIIITGHEICLAHIMLTYKLLRYKKSGFGFRLRCVGVIGAAQAFLDLI
jgi:hypothetical protein